MSDSDKQAKLLTQWREKTAQTIERRATIPTETAINRKHRTVEVAFSTGEPVEDIPGFAHILEHSANAVDLARLNDGAPVLVNHDPNDHVGVVERAWVGDGPKGRAILRYGESARADEIFNDVVNGIRPNVSVRADIHEAEIDRELTTDARTVIRVTRWQPVEISVASVPADTGTGVGRTKPAAQTGVVHVEQDAAPNEAQINQARRDAAKGAIERAAEIMAIADEFGVHDIAREYLTTGKTSDEDIATLRRTGIDAYYEKKQKELEDAEAGKSIPQTALGLSRGETDRFSVTRVMNALLENKPSLASFELECSTEIARSLDREPRGVFIPWEVQVQQFRDPARTAQIRREMNTGTPGQGAEYVGTIHDAGNFIEQLRNNVVTARAGARMLPGLRQNVDIPRKDSGATFQWLAEGGTVTLSDLGTGKINLTPTTVGGGVKATRRMMKQSIPAIDDLIMQDLAEGAAEAIDLGVLEGTGAANQPLGVVNQTGINTQIVNPAGQPEWDEVVGFETAVGTDNALRGSLAWVTTTAVVGHCKSTEKSTGSGRFIMEAEAASMFGPRGTLNGYAVFDTNAVTAGTMIFGNWAEVLIGMWGVLDLRPDPYTAADEDALIIRAFQDIDTDVRHAVAFCKNVLA